MSCGSNTALDALKDKQNELNAKLKGGKDALGDIQGKLNEMKAELDAFKPTLPKVDSLQDKINELSGTSNPLDITSKIQEMKDKFGAAVPNLDQILADLQLDQESMIKKLTGGLPATGKSDICALVPNVEASEDGTVKEQPTEPKVPEEPPAAPEPTPVIEKDLEELNRRLLQQAYSNNLKYIAHRANSIFDGFGSRKKNQKFYDSTWEEQWIELHEAAGADYNTYRKNSRTKEELRFAQEKLSSKYPKAKWDFQKEGQILKETYNLVKEANPHLYAQAQDFNTAAAEWFVRRKAKMAEKTAT